MPTQQYIYLLSTNPRQFFIAKYRHGEYYMSVWTPPLGWQTISIETFCCDTPLGMKEIKIPKEYAELLTTY